MELEELRNTWQSVKPHIDSQISEEEKNKTMIKKNDVKSKLLKRSLWEGISTLVFIILMALTPFWSPLKFPYWWLLAVCSTTFIANLYGIKVYRAIKAINLWNDTNNDILMTIVSIKKMYRNLELAIATVLIPLLIWFSFTPMFIHTWRMFFTWGLTIIAFILEYLWYRNNIRNLNKLINWEKD